MSNFMDNPTDVKPSPKPVVQCTFSLPYGGWAYSLSWRIGELRRFTWVAVGMEKPSKAEERRIKTTLYRRMVEDIEAHS